MTLFTFLAATMPIHGHVYPVMSIVRELTRREHKVYWYTGAAFRDDIGSVGAEWVPMREAFDFSELDPEHAFPERKGLSGVRGLRWDFKHLFIDNALGQRRDLGAFYASHDVDVVFSEFVFFGTTLLSPPGAPPAAGIGIVPLGIASRDTAPFGPGLPPSASAAGRIRNRILNWSARRFIFGDVQDYLDGRRAELGVPAGDEFFLDEVFARFDTYLQGTIPELEYPRSDLPEHVRFVGPFFPPATTEFAPPDWWEELGDGRRTVLVTQGTVVTDPANLIWPTIRALANEDVRVVVTGPRAESVMSEPNLPSNVRATPFIPYDELLPRVDVMVTNGGYGGVHYALKHGVPLVVAGTTEEKAEICARIAWSGAGRSLKTDNPSQNQLSTAIRDVLDHAPTRRKASEMAKIIAEQHASESAADALEAIADQGTATGGPLR